jgi:HAD superfamily hydrolase (TIGR01458 family)
MGFEVPEDELFTALDAARRWLQQRGLCPYCLVHPKVLDEFADLAPGEPDAVLIADAADDFNYDNLNRAFQLCVAGAPLLGVGRNRYFKSGDSLLMDAGAFIRAVEFAAGVEATIVGKPEREFFLQVLDSLGVPPVDALMVGDDVYGDVEGALAAGLEACLVRTGKYRPGDEERVQGEFPVVDSVQDAVEIALSRGD